MLLRGDGEIDSMTDGQCGRCGGAVDQAGACHTCDSEMPKAVTTTGPETPVATSVEPHQQAAAHSTEPTRSDAVLRFGWDPTTDEVVAPLPAREPEPEPRKTVAEAALPAPELEALFAALESSPIRIKPREPEPPAAPVESIAADAAAERIVAQAPVTTLPFARPFETAPVATAQVDGEIDLLLDTIQLPSIAPQSIALKPAANSAAPVALEPAHAIEESPIASPHIVADVPAIDRITESFNIQAAIAAERTEAALEVETMRAIDVPAPAAIEVRVPQAPTPAIVAAPPAIESPRALDLPMPIAAAPETPRFAPEPVAPPPPAAVPVMSSAQAAVSAHPAAEAATQSVRWRPLLTAAATVAILAVIGVPLSKLWLERAPAQPGAPPAAAQPAPQRAPAARVTAPAPAPAAASPSPAPRVAAPPAPAAGSTTFNSAVVASPRPAATERPQPVLMSPDAQVPPRPVRPAAPAVPPAPQPAPQVAALAPAITAPTASGLPTAAVEPAPAPAPAAAATPAAGPFFELNDVDSPPRVTARTDTVLPAGLEGQPVNEIVVVRILVSQTGRPALVSLLRHSKAGLALDEAVIAAVKQWTFTPALKRGQTVSCFYHAAVPVSQR